MAVGLLQRNRGNVGMVGFAMSEENLDRILAHPHGMVCSDGGSFAVDGPTRRGHPHPRGLGTFPRVLGRYVRERKALTLPQAINKMTALPASRIHLRDRGLIAPRMAADVVVFDPATVADTATFEEPFQYPVGIDAVIVNGAIAFRDGQRAERHTGKACARPRGHLSKPCHPTGASEASHVIPQERAKPSHVIPQERAKRVSVGIYFHVAKATHSAPTLDPDTRFARCGMTNLRRFARAG